MNSKEQALTRSWEEQDRQIVDFVYAELLKTVQGRKFLFDQLALCKVGQQPFTSNALSMSFNCGELNVGQQILTRILSVDPDGWVQMQKEANDVYRERTDSLANARAGTGELDQ
jgi:hypothetical protein